MFILVAPLLVVLLSPVEGNADGRFRFDAATDGFAFCKRAATGRRERASDTGCGEGGGGEGFACTRPGMKKVI